MWVRGLKQQIELIQSILFMSHPMWVRGLKQHCSFESQQGWSVAPHVGAWIETPHLKYVAFPFGSHPMWVRGLKHDLLIF